MAKSNELPNIASEIRALVQTEGKHPPVESWHPERGGEIDIRIGRDGTWYYQGSAMARESVVRLFSTILRKDDDHYFLVTPVEKMRIAVDDAPFVIRMMDVEGSGEKQKIHLSTNVGDNFTLSELHPLTVRYNQRGEPSPYALVRAQLKALISRKVYYEMADLVVSASGVSEGAEERFGVWSDGEFFIL